MILKYIRRKDNGFIFILPSTAKKQGRDREQRDTARCKLSLPLLHLTSHPNTDASSDFRDRTQQILDQSSNPQIHVLSQSKIENRKSMDGETSPLKSHYRSHG